MSVLSGLHFLWGKFARLWSTCLLLGYAKLMPGTLCSIIATIILYFYGLVYNEINLLLFFVIFFLSLVAVAKFLKEINKTDPSCVVIDEALGVLVIFLSFSTFQRPNDYLILLALFRWFDIFKPFPINIVDQLSKKGGYYFQALFIILDDIAAAILSILSFGLIKYTLNIVKNFH